MSWVVRVACDPAAVDRIETAAVMADSSGWAQTAASDEVELLVGFEDHPAAAKFARGLPNATVEPVSSESWSITELATVQTSTGALELEVATAFGHGGHPTTRLALDAIARLGDGRGRTLFDVGSGTGVLSIAAARQGFVSTGCDIDHEAVAVAVRNAERNDVEETTSFVVASPDQLATDGWTRGAEGFDAAVVNTLVGVHEHVGASVSGLCAPSAPIIITGVCSLSQLERAAAAYSGRRISMRATDGDWILAVLSPDSQYGLGRE